MTTRRRSSTEAPDRNDQDSRVRGMERETGFEPATLSLGMRTGSSAAARTGWQTSEDRTIGDPNRLIDSGELRHGRVSNAIRISQADLAAFLHGGS